MNSAAHQILFDRIVAMDIHTQVKNTVDTAVNVDNIEEYVYFDFGTPAAITAGNWNNPLTSGAGSPESIFNVIDFNGTDTGIVFTLSNSFTSYNTGGTQSPNTTIPFPLNASRDSFFGVLH